PLFGRPIGAKRRLSPIGTSGYDLSDCSMLILSVDHLTTVTYTHTRAPPAGTHAHPRYFLVQGCGRSTRRLRAKPAMGLAQAQGRRSGDPRPGVVPQFGFCANKRRI